MSDLQDKLDALLALKGEDYYQAFSDFHQLLVDTQNDISAALMLAVTATSTSSATIQTGAQTITVATGKSFVTGQRVTVAHDGAHKMTADVVSYDSGTGALAFTVNSTNDLKGTGTYSGASAWTVALSGDEGPPGPSYWNAPRILTPAAISGTPSLATIVDKDVVVCNSAGGVMNLTVDPACTRFIVQDATGSAGTNKITITPPTGHAFFDKNANEAIWIDWSYGFAACLVIGTSWSKHP